MHKTPLRFTPPPRRVPLSLRIVNFCNGAAQVGWGVFGFGMIFFWVFGTAADFSFLTFRGDGRVVGRVTAIEATNASENEQRVMASHYEYSVAGRPFQGTSYTTAATPHEGAEVTVEFDPDDPRRSRIAGMRRTEFGPAAMLVVIFPFVGLIILIFALRTGVKRNHLLREGLLTTGTLVSKEPTATTVNKRRVWKLTFEYIDRAGQRREVEARTTDTERLQDEKAEPLLYDPSAPSTRAYMLDEAPARPTFDADGQLEARPLAAVVALFIPALVIVGHGFIAAVKLGLARW